MSDLLWRTVMVSDCLVLQGLSRGSAESDSDGAGTQSTDLQGASKVPPSPFGDTAQERLLLEEEGSFRGPVPGAQRGQRGFVIGDFHGNRLRGAAKVKREAGEQKMPGRGSRRS